MARTAVRKQKPLAPDTYSAPVREAVYDPYAQCPHARDVIERMLSRIQIMPFQKGTFHGAVSAQAHEEIQKEKLRDRLIREFLGTQAEAFACARRQGLTMDMLRKLFPHTPLPSSY